MQLALALVTSRLKELIAPRAGQSSVPTELLVRQGTMILEPTEPLVGQGMEDLQLLERQWSPSSILEAGTWTTLSWSAWMMSSCSTTSASLRSRLGQRQWAVMELRGLEVLWQRLLV